MSLKKAVGFQKIKSSTLIKNIASLGFIQLANYAIPLLIIPIVVRALGVENIGKVSYAQGIISYLTIIVNYGFEFSATKQIALNKENKQATNGIFWGVMSIKFSLLLFSFILLGCLTLFSEKINNQSLLFLLIAISNIGIVAFPTWFLQGIEKMGYMSIFNFLIKLFGGVCTVYFVTSPDDYLYYAAFPSISFIVFGILSLIWVVYKYQLFPVDILSYKQNIRSVLSKGFPIFLNNIFVSLYTTANFTILGIYVDDLEIGYYSGAQKIIGAILMVTSMPINIALFPAISRKIHHSKSVGLAFFKKILIYSCIGLFFGCLFIYFLSPLLVKLLLGEKFTESVEILQIMSPLPLLVVVASLLTVQGMYGFGLQKLAPFVGAILGAICIGINIFIVPGFGAKGAAFSWVIVEIIEVVLVGLILYFKLPRIINSDTNDY